MTVKDRRDDTFCEPCGKFESEHATCPKCKHADCDCICDFLRNDWPTHPANRLRSSEEGR